MPATNDHSAGEGCISEARFVQDPVLSRAMQARLETIRRSSISFRNRLFKHFPGNTALKTTHSKQASGGPHGLHRYLEE